MLSKLAVSLLVTSTIAASAETATPRPECPNIHVFGARHTTATDDYGLAKELVNAIVETHPGATAERIDYPAQGGSTDIFAWSAQTGVRAVTHQVTSFVNRCPDTQIVLVGYSQGAEIIDDAMCGGPDPTVNISSTEPPLSSEIGSHVKAIVWMGNPRHTIGAPFNLGTASASGTRPRSENLSCLPYTDIIQSYCDQGDRVCTDGDSWEVHGSYAAKYTYNALEFVNERLY
ncbi:acetylxylan esterase precursor [Aspergillus candidus]|uniref:Acetylxylan esterase n=1 Tax=Aspergillus candidus TaxID=41067 RepID=A0A2I2F7N5_ASPCN|nr:acetylxylan esterase precursor [Aspergillus candidus]PLB36636.1 acetylxylan esterase precursor [Aspergillus candidus]